MGDLSCLQTVRGTIVSDVVEIARQHSVEQRTNEGSFGIPRQVFCYVDFLGSIAYGRKAGATTQKMVDFIKEFFPSHYEKRAEIIVAMWRQGTVHGFVPKAFYVMEGTEKVRFGWSSNNDIDANNRNVNMRIAHKEGDNNALYLMVNICQLADDLLDAFDKFIEKMKKEASFKDDCLRRLQHVLDLKEGRGKIKEQILEARDSPDGILGDRMQVRWLSTGISTS